MKDFLISVRHAFRSFRKNPGFAVSALAILTLGIGANTTIFSVVNAVLLRPLPFPQSETIVTVYHVPPAAAFPGLKRFTVSPANFLDWRKQSTSFESMSAFGGSVLQIGRGGRPQSMLVTTSDAALFEVLRVPPEIGRVFTSEECAPGRDGVIVLSHGFAASHFGSPANALGKQLESTDRTYRVIGVMPASFRVASWFPASTEGWIPNAWTAEDRAERANHNWLVVGRLRSGVTVDAAQADINVISDRLARDYPNENKGWGAVIRSLTDDLVGDVRPALLALLGAVSFVLLIACANTANLVLARTISRRKELAIRAALGASSRQILRPILFETTLLSVLGGLLGLAVAQAGQSLVMGALADQLPQATEVQIDIRVLAFTLLASVLTGLLAGLVAGLRLVRGDVHDSLKQGLGRSDSYSGGRRTRTALVVAEVASSIILLIGAGLMVRSLAALRGTDPGFESANVLTMSIPIPKPADRTKLSLFYDEFLPRVAALPGVESVAAIDNLPLLEGGSEQPVTVDGRPAEVFALQRNVSVRQTTPNYFRTMRIPIVAGRDFEPADISANRPVVVISKAMADLFWPGENPLGRHLRVSFTPEIAFQVIGIVADTKARGLSVPEPVTMMYTPVRHQEDRLSLVVRGDGSPQSRHLLAGVTRVLANINSELSIRNVRPMDEVVATTLSQQRFSMWLFTALAGLSYLLAAVGIYSVLAYSVRSRVREIGVRMALGARSGDVLRLVITEGLKPTLIGVVLGMFGAWALGGILSNLIYGVSPTDPLTFI
ncbi:MAG TPA: ABC transporter permease, partial [Bryobacteraceae bacterium]|nr:ABC transporter permease [Bryobacteraceae bacterium]